MSEPAELYSLLIPLKAERLLVPRMCVAEVVSFTTIERDDDADKPDWYLGQIDWNGRRIPVVSFDGAAVEAAPSKKGSRTRIVVFHAVTPQLRSGFYGVLTQGFPQLVRVNRDVLTLDPDGPPDQEPPALCRVRMIHEFPLIPDVEALEGMLGSL